MSHLKLLLLLLLLLSVQCLFSNTIDSLTNEISLVDKKVSPDKFIKLSLKLGNTYGLKNQYHKALSQFNEALIIAKRQNLNYFIFQSNENILNTLRNKGDFKKIVELGEDILEEIPKDSLHQKGIILKHLGEAKVRLGFFEDAYQNQINGLEIFQEIKDSILIANLEYNIGTNFHYQKLYKKAKEHYLNCYTICKQTNDKHCTQISLAALAITYDELGDKHASIATNEKLITEIDENKKKNHLLLAYVHNNLASAYFYDFDSINLDKVEYHVKKGMKINNQLKNQHLKTKFLCLLGDIDTHRRDYIKAEENFDKALCAAKENGFFKEEKSIYESYAYLFYKKGDINKYKIYNDLLIETKDSLYNSEVSAEISKLEENHKRKELENKQQLELLKKDQEIQTIEYTNQLKLGSGCLFFLFIISVIILKKQRDEKAKNLQLARKNEEINRQNDMLKTSNRDLEKFAQIISHDLREPLRNISGFTSLLKRKIEKKITLDESMNEYMNFITNGTQQMGKLLHGILEYSKLSSQKEKNVQQINTNELIKEIITDINHLVKENHASFNISNLPHLNYNRAQLYQVFLNLISNAIYFKSEEFPEIKIYCEEKENDHIFFIEDNGIGIEHEYQEKIFDAFQRLNNRSKYTGSGLGLSTCKKIIEANEGKIFIHNSSYLGTTFCFTIPKTEIKTRIENRKLVVEEF